MFKKIISLFLITSLISAILLSCGNNEDKVTKNTTQSTVPDQTTLLMNTPAATTQTTPTTQTVSEFIETISTTERVIEIIKHPIEKNVIVSVGENSVSPTLIHSHSIFDLNHNGMAAVGDGPLIFGYPKSWMSQFEEDKKIFPVISCTSLEDIKINVNGNVNESPRITLYNEDGDKVEFSGKGRYYACIYVKFTGNIIMENGNKLFEEYSEYGAFFTLDVD